MLTDKTIQELSEVIQSSSINFLLGAGTSTPFLPLLGSIETKLNEASTDAEKEVLYKEYFLKVMAPNKDILSSSYISTDDFNETRDAYTNFFKCLTDLLIRRKSTILNKQVNLFSTNIDLLMEMILEEMDLEYNDGFSGKFNPMFSLSNFKKASFQRSLHFDHVSEIPLFNIIKIHGSVTWMHNSTKDKILFSKDLTHVDETLASKSGNDFIIGYKKILVVNPEAAKHLESVLNLYYSELLRLYSSELEKENATLFVLGFSMDDLHIREITLRAAKSNPTLRIFICCSKEKKTKMEEKMESSKHSNIQFFTPDTDGVKFKLSLFNDQILKKIKLGKLTDKSDAE